MQLMLVLALAFALMVAIFAVQNAEAITVQFLQWQVRTSLVVVILAAAALGALSAGMAGAVRQIRTGLRVRSAQSQIQRLEKELAAVQEERERLRDELRRLREQQARPSVPSGPPANPAP